MCSVWCILTTVYTRYCPKFYSLLPKIRHKLFRDVPSALFQSIPPNSNNQKETSLPCDSYPNRWATLRLHKAEPYNVLCCQDSSANMFVRFIHISVYFSNIIFHCRVIIHCLNMAQNFNSLFYWWIFELFPVWSHYKRFCYEIVYVILFLWTCFYFSWINA